MNLIDYGIDVPNGEGDYKIPCPECSHQRKKKSERCLSVRVKHDGAMWYCHHCNWKGGIADKMEKPMTIYKKPKPSKKQLSDRALEFFTNREINQQTLTTYGIFCSEKTFNGQKSECISFPYFIDGDLVNVKYRGYEKIFMQEKDSKPSLFGQDTARESNSWINDKAIVFVEGEMDVLACYEAGIQNAVSLPNGAPKEAKYQNNDKRYDAIRNCDYLEHAEKIILAVDNDPSGHALKNELAHRFGKDRCWTVTFPTIHDTPIKDANECLIVHGKQTLNEVLENCKPFPVDGLHNADEYMEEVFDLYEGNLSEALSTGYPELDKIYKVMTSIFTVVTGVPNHGKSNFIDQIAMNMAKNHDWRFAIFSPEHSTANHLRRLSEKFTRKPFDRGTTERMTTNDLVNAMLFMNEHFYFIESDDSTPDIDWLLDKARIAVMRNGVKGVIIDPYNEISAKREGTKREDEHIRDLISSCKKFTRNYDIAMWLVAHPSKMHRDGEGKIPPPNMYDISGAAHWNNMADVGMVVHRDFDLDETNVIIRKVREQGLYGNIGQCSFSYSTSERVYKEKLPETKAHWYQD